MPVPYMRDWYPRDRVSNLEHLQDPIDGVRALAGEMQPAGISYGFPRQYWLGRVVPAGPNAENDLVGCMYWVERLYVPPPDSESTPWTVKPVNLEYRAVAGDDEGPRIVPALNLTEYLADSHRIDPIDNEPVLVMELPRAGDERTVYVFEKVPTVDYWLLILSSVRDGTNYRWTYTGQRLPGKPAASWVGWAQTVDDPSVQAKNTAEALSSGPYYVNGVPRPLPTGVTAILPVPNGLVVPVRKVAVADVTEPEYWFTYPNAPQVACP